RFLEGEHLPDIAFGPTVEERAVGRRLDPASKMPPQRHRGDSEHREGDELRLPGPGHRERDEPDRTGGEPEPQHEHARGKHLEQQQRRSEDEPGPGSVRDDPFQQHDTLLARRQALPVVVGPVGPVERRGAGGGRSSLPNVALAISPMPASEPSTLTASIGSIRTFWFGDCASCPNAFRYLSATK